MDRIAATSILTNEYADLATDAAFSASQLTLAYNFAIDMSLRQLGYTEDVLATTVVPQAQITAYLALLSYYALKRFARLLSVRFDVQVIGALQAFRSQAFKQVSMLLEVAEKECAAQGYAVGATQGLQMGRMELDFLEPDYPFGLPFPYLGGDF